MGPIWAVIPEKGSMWAAMGFIWGDVGPDQPRSAHMGPTSAQMEMRAFKHLRMNDIPLNIFSFKELI